MKKRPNLPTINETFTKEEFDVLKLVKGKKSWHDFIMLLKDYTEEDTSQ